MNKKNNIHLMYLIIFLQGFVFYGPIATIYRQANGVSIGEIFLIESISWILIIILEVPWGWFADRFGYKKTLVIANFIFLLSKIVFWQAESITMFLMERILLSISIAGLSGCDMALIYLSVDKKENSEKVFAFYNWCGIIGFLIASMLSTFIINISIKASAFFTIIPYAMAFIASLLLVEVSSEVRSKPNIINSIKTVLLNKKNIVCIISFALIAEVSQSITVFLNQGQYIRSGIGIKYFGIILAGMQLAKLVSIKSYKVSEKWGRVKMISFFALGISMCTGMLILVETPFLSIILIGIISVNTSFMEPMIMELKNSFISIESVDRASILSIYSMIGSVTSAIVNPIIGFTSNMSIEYGLGICFIISIIAFISMALLLMNVDYK